MRGGSAGVRRSAVRRPNSLHHNSEPEGLQHARTRQGRLVPPPCRWRRAAAAPSLTAAAAVATAAVATVATAAAPAVPAASR